MKLQYDKVFCTYLYSGQEESYFDDGEAVAQLLQNNIVFINYEQGVIVNCNDIFAWAVADGERLENETEVEALYKLCMPFMTIAIHCIPMLMMRLLPLQPRKVCAVLWPFN